MKFLQVLYGVEVLSYGSNPDVVNPDIGQVEYDSRRVTPGSLFVDMKGEATDGNRYIDKAIEMGAVAVVSDSLESSGPFPKGPATRPTQADRGLEWGTRQIAWARV